MLRRSFDYVSAMAGQADIREPFPMWYGWAVGQAWRDGYDAAINDQSGGKAADATLQTRPDHAGTASPPDPIAEQPEDVEARLLARVLPVHGGTAPPMSHWNLTEGDSLLHKDAAGALRRERERADAAIAANKDCMLHYDDVRADRDRLAAECERLRDDAERYRWLRLGWQESERARYGYNDAWHEVWDLQSPEALDAAIDAARGKGSADV